MRFRKKFKKFKKFKRAIKRVFKGARRMHRANKGYYSRGGIRL